MEKSSYEQVFTKDIYNLKELAELFSTSYYYWYLKVLDGSLKAVKVGKSYSVLKPDLLEFLQQHSSENWIKRQRLRSAFRRRKTKM